MMGTFKVTKELLRTATFGIVAAFCLEPRTSSACLLTETRPESIYPKETKEAGAGLLEQIIKIVNSWLVSERDDKSLELPSSDALKGIAKTFNDLSNKADSSKTYLKIAPQLQDYVSREAERLSIKAPTTYADAFQTMAGATAELAEQLDNTSKNNLGPATSTDIQKREAAFSRLANRTFRLVEIANYLGLLLQIPAS
jgi:hypothetical protein